eukprot:472084_1
MKQIIIPIVVVLLSIFSNYRIGITIGILYVLMRLYSNYKYNQMEDTINIEHKIVLITGCDCGLGYAMAITLQQKGYRIFATTLQKESANKLNSNKSFTNNGSIAAVMDVTKIDDIYAVKSQLIQYLNTNKNTIFWGIINNAGYYIPASFELVPIDMDMHNRNVLYLAPINVTKIILPLMHGRKNYKQKFNIANGGRIINIGSASTNSPVKMGQSYSSAKAGLAFWSKTLNMELSPQFGIWVISMESAAYYTNIFKTSENMLNKIKEKYLNEQESNEYYKELLDVYSFDKLETNWKKRVEKVIPKLVVSTIDAFVDDIYHCLTAKYPKRVYYTGWGYIFNILYYLPLSILARISGS